MIKTLRFLFFSMLMLMCGNVMAQDVIVGTCADVIAGADGTIFQVKGTVKSISNTTYGNWILKDDTGEITIYGTLDAEGKTKNFSSLGINQGDIVTVKGPKKTYKETTIELVDVTVIEIEHTGEAPVEPTISGGTTPETAITVATALTAINGMQDNQKTTASYYVKGVVQVVTEISNGNASFIIADATDSKEQFTVYRALGPQKKSISDENLLKAGDEVIVYGQLQKYVKNETITPELAQGGYIYSINGVTEMEEKPIVLEGEGTIEKPYTVADLKAMTIPANSTAEEGQAMVWVKGVIAGSLNSAGSAILEGDAVVASNLGLAVAAGETDATKCVPVQLPTGGIRTALNVLDNPANVGKEVAVYGYILKYMGKTGLKNIADFILDGQQYTTGITVMKAEKANDAIFNLNGQRLVKAQKGLNIIGSKKVMVK